MQAQPDGGGLAPGVVLLPGGYVGGGLPIPPVLPPPQGGQLPRVGQGVRPKFIEGKVFLGGVSNDTTQDSLVAYCGQWGEIADVHVMEGKGYAFVTFGAVPTAQAFLEHREHYIDGKKVDAKAAVPKDQGGGKLTKKMFVGGVGELADHDFRQYFSVFGNVMDAAILRKPEGTSRGFGFVTFDNEMAVEKCLVMEHFLSGKRVDVKRAVGREGGEQQQQPQQGGLRGMQGGGYMNMGIMVPPGAGGGAYNQQTMSERTGKQSDWVCSECSNKNYGWRSECNRCKSTKPGAGSQGYGMGGAMNPAMMGGAPPPGMMGGGMMGGGMMGGGMMGGGMMLPAATMAQLMPGMQMQGMGGMNTMQSGGMAGMGYGGAMPGMSTGMTQFPMGAFSGFGGMPGMVMGAGGMDSSNMTGTGMMHGGMGWQGAPQGAMGAAAGGMGGVGMQGGAGLGMTMGGMVAGGMDGAAYGTGGYPAGAMGGAGGADHGYMSLAGQADAAAAGYGPVGSPGQGYAPGADQGDGTAAGYGRAAGRGTAGGTQNRYRPY